MLLKVIGIYSKTCVKRPLSESPKIDFQDQLPLKWGSILQYIRPSLCFVYFWVAVLHKFYSTLRHGHKRLVELYLRALEIPSTIPVCIINTFK